MTCRSLDSVHPIGVLKTTVARVVERIKSTTTSREKRERESEKCFGTSEIVQFRLGSKCYEKIIHHSKMSRALVEGKKG